MADDFDFGGFLKTYLTDGKGGMSSFVPAMAQAWQQYNNAGKYEDLGREAYDASSPVNNGDRDYYKQRLRQSYDDPNAILNDPGHKIQVQRGLDQVSATNAAKGYLGGGRMYQDLSKYASDTDATYLDAERKQLSNLAGFGFDPANGAKYLMEGGKLSLAAKDSALRAMFSQFNNANSPQNKPTGSGNPDGSKLPPTPPPGWSQEAWNQLRANFTTQPGAPGGGGVNGTGDGPPGPGGDAPGSGGDQFDWEKYYAAHPEVPRLDVDGNPINDNTVLPWWEDPTGHSEVNDNFGGIWEHPENINWDTVNYGAFDDSDWASFSNFFGLD